MPLCAKCQNPFVCHCSAEVRKPLGAVAESCPLDKRPGAIWVHVTDDRGVDVKDVNASNDGALKPTDANGVAVYDPVPVGEHKVRLSHRSVTALKLYEEPKKTTRKPTVAAGEITYVAYQIARKPVLKVKVVEKGNAAKVFEGATVTVTGAESPAPKPSVASGLSDFEFVTAGDYKIKVELKADDKKTHATTLDFSTVTSDVTLAAGHDKEIVVEAEPLNIVTPKIELEYKIVLLDRKLHDKQTAADETKIYPGATRIEVSATQTNKAHPFTKTGKLVAPNVDVFTDEACTKPLTEDLKAEDLLGAKPKELWLRGKTAGKFEIKLTLEADPADRFVKLADEPAKEEMGVVELKLELHEQDIAKLKAPAMQVDPDTDPETDYHDNLHAKVMPDQKPMSDDDKIGVIKKDDAEKPGRLLHVQKDGHFGRAKLVVAKLDAAQLPAGTDDYDIVLKVGRGVSYTKGADVVQPIELQGTARDMPKSGGIALFDAEKEGAKKEDVSYKISALKAAAQTLWVEGSSETDQPCDVRLDAGMNRAAGGLANTIKRNGDWARFTVVQVEKLEVIDTRKPDSEEPRFWDAAEKQFFVNIKKDAEARKIKIQAKLTKPIKNVVLHLMLSPDKDNKKAANWGEKMPDTWTWKDITKDVKHLDKADRKDLLHLSEKTDAEGKAAKELILSRFGGDKFWPGAYIEQDPHLAKYYEGHAELKKRKPVLATDAVVVYRKFAYQRVDVAGRVYPEFTAAENAYKTVKAKMLKVASITKSQADLQALPKPSLQKAYNYKVGAGNDLRLNVSDANQSQFFAMVKAQNEHPIKVPIVSCDFNWANERDSGTVTGLTDLPVSDFPKNVRTNVHVCEKPLQGGELLKAGTWSARDWDAAAGGGTGAWVNPRNGTLAPGDVGVDSARDHINKVQVKLPAGIGATTAATRITITGLKVRGAKDDYLGGYNCDNAKSQAIVALYDPNDTVDYQNTIIHELGHAFHQTLNVAPAVGIPVNPNYLDTDTGPHCSYNTNKCVMFTSGPTPGCLNQYCPDCHPHMLVQDMAKLST